MTTKQHHNPFPDETRSEVARLMRQIDQEYEAAERGLRGLTFGTAQHTFITKRMEYIADHHQSLIHLVGQQEAARLINERSDLTCHHTSEPLLG